MDARESHDCATPSEPLAVSRSSSSSDLRQSECGIRSPAPPALLPWPARLVVFLALAALAVLAIRIIDRHAMEKMPTATLPAHQETR